MDQVIFADGSSEKCTYFSFLPDLKLIYIVLDDADWVKAVSVFTDMAKLQRIQYGDAVIEGYTHVDYIEPMGYGMKARLSPTR